MYIQAKLSVKKLKNTKHSKVSEKLCILATHF